MQLTEYAAASIEVIRILDGLILVDAGNKKDQDDVCEIRLLKCTMAGRGGILLNPFCARSGRRKVAQVNRKGKCKGSADSWRSDRSRNRALAKRGEIYTLNNLYSHLALESSVCRSSKSNSSHLLAAIVDTNHKSWEEEDRSFHQHRRHHHHQ